MVWNDETLTLTLSDRIEIELGITKGSRLFSKRNLF